MKRPMHGNLFLGAVCMAEILPSWAFLVAGYMYGMFYKLVHALVL